MLAGAGQVLDFRADTVDALRDGGPRVYLIFGGPDAGKFPFVALRCFDGLRFVCHGRLCEQVSLEVNAEAANNFDAEPRRRGERHGEKLGEKGLMRGWTLHAASGGSNAEPAEDAAQDAASGGAMGLKRIVHHYGNPAV